MKTQGYFLVCFAFFGMNAALSPPKFSKITVRSTSFVMEWDMLDGVFYQIIVLAGGETTPVGVYDYQIQFPKVTSPHVVKHIVNFNTGAFRKNLEPNTPYYIKFVVTTSTDVTDQLSIYMQDFYTASPAPTNLKISNVGSSNFDVSWSHRTVGEKLVTTGYLIFYTSPKGKNGSLRITTAESRSSSVRGLTSDTNYSITVRALTASDIVYSDDSDPVSLHTEIQLFTTARIAAVVGGVMGLIIIILIIVGVTHYLKAKRDAAAKPESTPRRKTFFALYWK